MASLCSSPQATPPSPLQSSPTPKLGLLPFWQRTNCGHLASRSFQDVCWTAPSLQIQLLYHSPTINTEERRIYSESSVPCHDFSSFNEHLHQFIHTTLIMCTVNKVLSRWCWCHEKPHDSVSCPCCQFVYLTHPSHRKEAIEEKLFRTFNLAVTLIARTERQTH